MTENILRRANVRLLPGDEQAAERMPQVVKSKSLSRLEIYPGLNGGGPQMISRQHIAHAERTRVNFFTCNFTCKIPVLAVLPRAWVASDAF